MGMKRGFQFAETMRGWYALARDPGERLPLSFSIHARAESILRYLSDRRVVLRGTLDAERLADNVPVEGTMLLDPLGQRIIGYELCFTGNDGQPYYFVGQKDVSVGNLVESMTTLPADIRQANGEPIATSVTRFDLRSDWLSFLRSWRLA